MSETTWNREKCLGLGRAWLLLSLGAERWEESQSKPETHSRAGEVGDHIWVDERHTDKLPTMEKGQLTTLCARPRK